MPWVSFLRDHNILSRVRGGCQGKLAKHMFLRGGERLGGNTPKSSLTAKEDDVLCTFSFQDGIFLRQWLLTHGHSAYCYL